MDKVPRFGSYAPPVNQSASAAGKERRLVSMKFLDTFFSILDWLVHFRFVSPFLPSSLVLIQFWFSPAGLLVYLPLPLPTLLIIYPLVI